MSTPSMLSLIEKKKQRLALNADELHFLCREYVAGNIPDYQVAAWLMAVCINGMDETETLDLTLAMVGTGQVLDWSRLGGQVVDKHSTGGVGDKTSLVLVPLLAAAGLNIVKMSGRGLGHTGGTLDKLESIPGFRVQLSVAELQSQALRIGCALVGQSPSLVPADRLLYALRDVTATVDSLPLIAASIMSKKLAAGAQAILLDVKYGAGAFMRTAAEARELARRMVSIGAGASRRTRAVLSPMEEPLGNAIGNSLEVREAIDTLRGGGPADLRELTLDLATQLLRLVGEADETDRGRLTDLLNSGAAAERFQLLVEAQGGDPRVVDEPDRLPCAERRVPLLHLGTGSRWVAAVDARAVAEVALELGAGRRTKTDAIESSVGIVLRKKSGDPCEPGEVLAEIHARTTSAAEQVSAALTRAFRFSESPTAPITGSSELIIG